MTVRKIVHIDMDAFYASVEQRDETLISNSPKKPLRIWMEVSDRDLLITRDNYHDWVLANQRMAKALAAKGYPYQFVFAKNAGHCDRAVKAQTLPLALEYVWQGYTPKK